MPSLKSLLDATVNQNSRDKQASPELAGEMLRGKLENSAQVLAHFRRNHPQIQEDTFSTAETILKAAAESVLTEQSFEKHLEELVSSADVTQDKEALQKVADGLKN